MGRQKASILGCAHKYSRVAELAGIEVRGNVAVITAILAALGRVVDLALPHGYAVFAFWLLRSEYSYITLPLCVGCGNGWAPYIFRKTRPA